LGDSAESVEKWLTEQAGFPRTGFAAQGFGATRFAAPNTNRDGSDDPAGRQKNRRVEIVIQRKKVTSIVLESTEFSPISWS
jgi:outer membrane protein OmpA-like peptidoglycan-associated protein